MSIFLLETKNVACGKPGDMPPFVTAFLAILFVCCTICVCYASIKQACDEYENDTQVQTCKIFMIYQLFLIMKICLNFLI